MNTSRVSASETVKLAVSVALVAPPASELTVSDGCATDVSSTSIWELKVTGAVSALVAIENPADPTVGPFETFPIDTTTVSPEAMLIGSLIVNDVPDPACQLAVLAVSVVLSKTTQSALEDPQVSLPFSPNDPPAGTVTVIVPPELDRPVVATNRNATVLRVAPTDNELGVKDAPVTDDPHADGERINPPVPTRLPSSSKRTSHARRLALVTCKTRPQSNAALSTAKLLHCEPAALASTLTADAGTRHHSVR